MVTATAATTNGVTPVEAVRWMLRKQLMVVNANIDLQKQVQAEASAWKLEHGKLAEWHDSQNELAYEACFNLMNQPEWLGIDGSLEERRAELMSISSLLDEGDYLPVSDFLHKEYRTLCVELATNRSASTSTRLSAEALMALATELVILAYK